MIHIIREKKPRFTKSPSWVLIRLVLTEIERFKNVKIKKGMYGHPDAVLDSVPMATHFFANFDIFKWLYLAYFNFGSIYTKLGDFVKLGLHFMTKWINSC